MRKRRPSDRLIDRLPTWLLANSFQVGFMLIPFVRAVYYFSGLTPTSLAEQAAPQALLFALLACYGASAVFTLYHYARGNLLFERAGLIGVCQFSLGYGITVFAADPKRGAFSFTLYLIVSLVCAVRVLLIPKLIRINQARLRVR